MKSPPLRGLFAFCLAIRQWREQIAAEAVSMPWEKTTKDENSMRKIILATAFAGALGIVPALAADNATDNSNNVPPSSSSSGPGVKGAPGSTAGPALKSDQGASGASSGEQGMSPSQDATGVPGAEDSTNGPSAKKPDDTGTSK
jgi:hypothetical protein